MNFTGDVVGDERGNVTVTPAEELGRELWRTLAGISTAICLLLSLHLIRRHIQHFTCPAEQRKIIGIIWLAPIFAIDSFISLCLPQFAQVLDMAKECYEAYAVYLFFALLVEFLGGQEKAVSLLSQRNEPLYRPFPMGLILRSSLLGNDNQEAFFMSCKRGVMQFVLVRPLVALLTLVLWKAGVYEKGDLSADKGYIYILFLVNISVSYAVYSLYCFYLALKQPLKKHHPVPKFIAIKAVVFLSFWQGVALALLAHVHVIEEVGSYSVEDIKVDLQNLIVCFEMLGAAAYHRYAFPWEQYDEGELPAETIVPGLDENFAISDAAQDFSGMFRSRDPSHNNATAMELTNMSGEEGEKALLRV